MNLELAPIILFAYNRPGYLKRTLECLEANELASLSRLFIYCDGPKEKATQSQLEKIEEVRRIAKSKKWCGEVTVITRDKNLGLAPSVISGVTEIVNRFGKIIVIEDDVVTSKYFLQYMNDALVVYQNQKKVLSIGTWNFFNTNYQKKDIFFAPIPDSISWGTWTDRWALFEPNSYRLVNQLNERMLVDKFNLEGRFDFYEMLLRQAKGVVSSWAIRWQAVAYLNDTLTIYPSLAVADHIGLGDDATHSATVDFSSLVQLSNRPLVVGKLEVMQDTEILQNMFRGYYEVTHPVTRISKMSAVKKLLKGLIPYGLVILNRRFENSKRTLTSKDTNEFSGNYTNWESANNASKGYDTNEIIDKVKLATQKVLKGEAAFERDSVLFYEKQFNWPVLANLQNIALLNDNKLKVIDFGGALGSTFLQGREYLSSIKNLQWTVVEQENFVEIGRQLFGKGEISFYNSIEQACEGGKPDVLLLSNVLQYLPNPEFMLNKVVDLMADYLIFDTTAFIEGDSDRLTVQTVPAMIYEASYPAWFFNERKFSQKISLKYDLICSFDSGIAGPILVDKKNAKWKGFVFKLKS